MKDLPDKYGLLKEENRNSQNLLTNGKVSVDTINPMVGTIALKKGLGASIDHRKITTIRYVITAITTLLVLLISQALSVSTRLFLSLICSISSLMA